jgi:hypothetical protein
MCKVNKLAPLFSPPQLKEKDSTLINNKKLGKIFIMCKEIQKGSSAKSYIRKGLPNVVPNICEEMRQYLVLFDEDCSHI